MPADLGFADLAGLEADRSGAGVALERLGILEDGAILAEFAKQPWSDFGPGSWQGTEEIMIGMTGKELFDLLAVIIQLALQERQLSDAGERQAAFGFGEGLTR